MDDRDIPEILRHLRAKLGLSQEERAARLGVAFSTLNRWENGRTTPRGRAKRAADINDELRKVFNKLSFGERPE